jgi:hypothetical protein
MPAPSTSRTTGAGGLTFLDADFSGRRMRAASPHPSRQLTELIEPMTCSPSVRCSCSRTGSAGRVAGPCRSPFQGSDGPRYLLWRFAAALRPPLRTEFKRRGRTATRVPCHPGLIVCAQDTPYGHSLRAHAQVETLLTTLTSRACLMRFNAPADGTGRWIWVAPSAQTRRSIMRLSGEAAWCQYTGAMIAIPWPRPRTGRSRAIQSMAWPRASARTAPRCAGWPRSAR